MIVELEGAPILAQKTAKSQGARAYVGSDDASNVEADILQEQVEVLADIAELMATDGSGVATASHKGSAKAAPALTPSYTYTHVLNAFAIECDSALIEDIEKLPGVKGVYQNRQYKAIPAEDNRALMGVVAIGVDANGNNKLFITDTEDDTTPENITVSFDISALNPDSLKILVIDYAGNTWTGYGKDGRLFADVPTDAWYADAVDYVRSKGLMVGVEEGKFAPMMTTTRAQLVTTLWRLAGEPEATHSANFSDVSNTAYYTDAVAWAAEEGIAAGFGDGKFHPNDALSREQLAAFLMKFADASGLDTDARENLSDYKDVKKSDWSYDPLSWAKAEGLLGGTTATTMQPKATANRAQLAAVLQRYCTNMATS